MYDTAYLFSGVSELALEICEEESAGAAEVGLKSRQQLTRTWLVHCDFCVLI